MINNESNTVVAKNVPLLKRFSQKVKELLFVKQPLWLKHTFEFFRTTGLHGYKYIVMDKTPIYEKVCWATAVLACSITAIVFVLIAWDWNQSNPTLTVIESTHYAIWKYPFPAVSICSLNKVSKSMALKLSHNLTIPSDVDSDTVLEALREVTVLLGNRKLDEKLEPHIVLLQKLLTINNRTVLSLIDQLTPSCRDILERCAWKGTTTRCDTLFQRVLSTEGYCCSFNYYAFEKHNFPSKVGIFRQRNPKRVAGCGYQTGLSILFRIDTVDYHSSNFGTYGSRIYIHYSYDYADESASAKLVGPGTETFFALSPEMTYSTPGIIGFPISERRCIFSEERSGKALAKYTYNNCLAECRGNIVYRLCGCIPYFLPNNGSRKICDFKSVKCVYESRKLYAGSYPGGNITDCHCVPDCQHFSYPIEQSSGRLTRANAYNALSFFKQVTMGNQSLAHIYYNDLVGTRYRKDIYMTWHGLLASFGGLLGLFVGFSIVSGFEMVYFFTLRFFFDVQQKNKMTEPNKRQPNVLMGKKYSGKFRHDWKRNDRDIGISTITVSSMETIDDRRNRYINNKIRDMW